MVYSLIGKASPAPILYSDIKKITDLNLDVLNINNLSGIEYFTALTDLKCNSNKLTTLNLSKNTALTSLECDSNNLTTLYSIKDTWDTYNYRPQYTDSTHTTSTDSLVITIKK